MSNNVKPKKSASWFNRTVPSNGLPSLCSDWAHKIVTAVLLAFLATTALAAAWLA
jgi:hypothetical protein